MQDMLLPVSPSVKTSVTGADDVLRILRSKPDVQALRNCLRSTSQFSINAPIPQVAQIVGVLVNENLPHYWQVLDETDKRSLLRCLFSVAGLGALLARIRMLTIARKDKGSKMDSSPLRECLEVVGRLLEGDKTIDRLWKGIADLTSMKRPPIWKELTSTVASGKLLSIVAEASDLSELQDLWIVDSGRYASWLGRNISGMEIDISNDEAIKARAELARKALSLGYTNQVVEAMFLDLLNGDGSVFSSSQSILENLAFHEQRNVLYTVLRLLSDKTVSYPDKTSFISGSAALLKGFTKGKPRLLSALVDWAACLSGGSVGLDHSIHRSVVAVLSQDQDVMQQALEKLMITVGDKLWIQHSPVLHQEVATQNLLMAVGYVYRTNPKSILHLARSSMYINAISNRLAASSLRSQFLGMVLGMSISKLVDSEDKKMKFTSEELYSSDGMWYQTLTGVDDKIGSIHNLKIVPATCAAVTASCKDQRTKKVVPKTDVSLTKSKIIAIEELEESGSEDDDLPVYEKPDSDAEDEDEDPTVIQRNRPTAPVYIRDLLAGLRDSENYDRHRLAISNAASLIRRKSNFGTEVSDHAVELATQLVGLKDSFDLKTFQEMRLQGMIAIVVVKPLEMGQWFSNTYFNGDYSMSQRLSVLSTLGLAARELAGYGPEDAALTNADAAPDFPSKRLPDKYDRLYGRDAASVTALTQRLERAMLQPLAVAAADKISGPNVLKVRTFSSRMEVEKKRKRAIPNGLAKIVADGFFFPLTGRWRAQSQLRGERSLFSDPFLLSHFLRTLSLILNASGTSTLSLPAMTAEFWSLLLFLRSAALNAVTVLEALLFSFMTILEINDNDQRRLAEDHSKELLETQAWVNQVFENLGGGSEEGERVRMLAAGVLVKTKEVVDKYQRLLLGDLVDYM